MGDVRVLDEQGVTHVFPDGSTPEMIAKAMNVKPPQASQQQTLDPSQPAMQPISMVDRFKNAISSPANYAAAVKENAQQIPRFASAVAQDVKGMVGSPGAVAKTIAGPAFNVDDIKRLYSMAKGHDAPEPEFLDRIGGSLGINTQGVKESAEKGDLAGVVGHAALPLGAIAGAHGAGAGEALPSRPSLQGALANRMAEVPPGERFSRQQVLHAAREKGVNLDLAQATDSPAAHSVKKATEYTLGGGAPFEANKTKNLSALESWANSTADTLSPNSAPREVVGAQMQAALKSHLEARQGAATQLFNDLDSNTGGVKPDATSIYDKAQQIVAENKAYYDKNPALKQGRAWQVVNDLAQREAATKPTTSTVTSALTDESGRPYTKQVQNKPQATPDSWQDLQKLRSDIMSEYRSPDVVGTRAEGWLKQLAGEVDKSMTGAGSGLSGPDLAKFRQANGIWESIKSTYDNPQSPYYNAIRTPYPSNLPANLASRPEVARQVRQTLSSLEDGSTAEGAFQRQFVENLINDKSGKLDLKNLDSKLSRTPDDVLKAMIGGEAANNLRILGKVAQKVTADSNPSGTAKNVVRTTEVVNALHNPIAGAAEIGGTYAAGKAINSTGVIDFLTRPRANR